MPNKISRKTYYVSVGKSREKTDTQIVIRVRNDVAEAFRSKCAEMGITQSQILHKAIAEFLARPE